MLDSGGIRLSATKARTRQAPSRFNAGPETAAGGQNGRRIDFRPHSVPIPAIPRPVLRFGPGKTFPGQLVLLGNIQKHETKSVQAIKPVEGCEYPTVKED